MKPTQQADNQFDVIVVGSGMGGMTAATILAQLYGKRVLLVEKHWTFGGLTHEFSRGKVSWDVGLHYVGQMQPGSPTRRIFDFVTGGGVRMNPMPDPYDHFVFPDGRFAMHNAEARTIDKLVEEFPDEERAIRQYYRTIHRTRQYFNLYIGVHNFMPGFLKPLLDAYGWLSGAKPNVTLQTYLDTHFRNNRLKGILAGIWGDYGVMPRDASFLVHAVLTDHYLGGAFYPEGGASAIGQNARRVLDEHGATILLSTEVTDILIEQTKAVGVRVRRKDGSTGVYYAGHILSGIGAEATYNRLLREQHFPAIRAGLDRLTNPHAFLGLYLSLTDSPATLGFTGANVWHFGSTDQNENAVSVHDARFPGLMYLSFPTLKGHPSPRHTVEVLSVIPYADVAQWHERPWRKRGTDYEQLKITIRDRLLTRLEAHYPGFGALVESAEVSTPLSLEFFTARRLGATYGLTATPERFAMPWLKPQTPIRNLYLCGQDVCVSGIVGAMMGGVVGAAAVRGSLGFFEIMGRISRQRSRTERRSGAV